MLEECYVLYSLCICWILCYVWWIHLFRQWLYKEYNLTWTNGSMDTYYLGVMFSHVTFVSFLSHSVLLSFSIPTKTERLHIYTGDVIHKISQPFSSIYTKEHTHTLMYFNDYKNLYTNTHTHVHIDKVNWMQTFWIICVLTYTHCLIWKTSWAHIPTHMRHIRWLFLYVVTVIIVIFEANIH